METRIVGTTNSFDNVEEMLKFSRACARVCYTEKDFEEVAEEEDKHKLTERLIKSGHHSVFEHLNFTFYFDGIPKMLAMILNNEKQYATSEKSARYTQMDNLVPEQKALYDKWLNTLIPVIDDIYPMKEEPKIRNGSIKKLAQENARYMTSVFTPTKMVYTTNLRQLNFIRNKFEDYLNSKGSIFTDVTFNQKIGDSIKDFVDQTKDFEVPGLENQTDRHLSLWAKGNRETNNSFGEVYSTSYKMSFAGLAQAHKHRTINYRIMDGTELGAPLEFFLPGIVKESGFSQEWVEDLEKVAKNDYPQAQLLEVNERGMREDFRSKMLLRMCGHAQNEIMQTTLATAKDYAAFDPNFNYPLVPKCQQDMKCASPCVWTGKNALDRIV